jgi:quinol monooxygenase YgiN
VFARTTLFEIDPLRISIADCLALFKETVLPELRRQPGCLGVIVMDTNEGKGMLLSLWESAEAASQSVLTGFYDQQIAKFLMFLRQPPGRDQYEVAYWELAESLTASVPGSSSVRENGR